jgi:5,10-methenyltetrahydrofolate synthetase
VTGRASDDDDPPEFASPVCYAHEFAEDLTPSAERRRADVMRWRKGERARLIAARLAIPAAERAAAAARIADGLDALLGDVAGKAISVYWPFRGEPDLRPWMRGLGARGARCALPVVVEKARPLAFRLWRPGDRLEPGIWSIPVPAEGAVVVPDVVIAPVVGFDRDCFRLGHGGGYFDRTLAALSPRPLAVGVGYAMAEIATIYPLSHDIPMAAIVTEGATIAPA